VRNTFGEGINEVYIVERSDDDDSSSDDDGTLWWPLYEIATYSFLFGLLGIIF
jgi:hypothetical protein